MGYLCSAVTQFIVQCTLYRVTVLYSNVYSTVLLYYTVQYSVTVLYCTVQCYCTILYSTVLLYYTVQYSVTLMHTVQSDTDLLYRTHCVISLHILTTVFPCIPCIPCTLSTNVPPCIYDE